jgi:hypothetical protein
MWRAIDGEIDLKNVVAPDELMNMINPLGQFISIDSEKVPDITEDFLNRIEDELAKFDKKEEASTMADLVHRCMKCNEIAYETSPGYYECSVCEFSWEVIDAGDK